jgi:hypothetical protein
LIKICAKFITNPYPQPYFLLGTLLVILHTKGHNLKRDRWREAVAQYLDHSVLNIVMSDSLTFDFDGCNQIIKSIQTMLKIHSNSLLSNQTCVCDNIPDNLDKMTNWDCIQVIKRLYLEGLQYLSATVFSSRSLKIT